MRRSTVLAVAAAAVSLAALVGCEDDKAPTASPTASPTVPATTAGAAPTATPTPTATATPTPTAAAVATTAGGAIDPEKALALAEATPYAATQDFTTEAGPLNSRTKARVNLNGPVRSGRLTESMSAAGGDVAGGSDAPNVVVTGDGTTYVRSGSSWRTSPLGDRVADYHGYAKALLALGPSARTGMEDCDGTPCFHLAGTVGVEQVKPLEAEHYKILKSKGVEGFRLDQWIDAQGRTVRFDRRTDLGGVQIRTRGTFRDFGPVERIDPPR
ncbi:hypothetical protein [Kitasatospora sp. NPDC059827]|uniref:hypothetical protein n=1 Tax=Kitasatospora sp. NPDC059827 TaxID=3346964 RepID=UPI003645FD1A